MTKIKKQLYIGRFQPLHFGHLAVIKDILCEIDGYLFVVIGSSEKSHTLENPLTSDERVEILEAVFEDQIGKTWRQQIKIFKVPDINNADLWVEHLNSFVPQYSAVVTGSKEVMKCYKSYNSQISTESEFSNINQTAKKIYSPNLTEIKKINFQDYPQIHATQIRELMIKDPDWSKKITKFVPKTVAKKLQQWKIDERLRKIA